MKEIPCIFCDVTSNDTVIRENGFTGKRCPQCSLIYISPRPSLEEIVDLYGHDSAHITAEEHISDELRKRTYARHHLKKLKKYIQSGKLLEVGAGAGFFLDEAKKAGFEPFGLEFNPGQARFMRDTLGIPCEESPIHPGIFGGKQFDVIYHCDVISHLYDPVSDFRMMHKLLKKDGILFFETGNFAEMDAKYYPYIPTFMYPDHLFFFGLENLKTLLHKTGFELHEVKRYSILPQLRIKKLLASSDEPAHIPVENGETGDENLHKINGSKKSSPVNMLKVYVNYIMRYMAGAITPKQKRPQTMLIAAGKK